MHPVVGLMKAMYDHAETSAATEAAKNVPKPKRPKLTKTEKVLVSMLVENTGCDILDSGGAYGRSWQRNQGRAFWEEPETSLSFAVREYDGETKLEIDVTHNVYHWLRSRLTYDAKMDRRFQNFARRAENKDDYDMQVMDKFMTYLEEKSGIKPTGFYGEGEPMSDNTYNGEDLLSQTLQYLFFGYDGTYYVLLQIHGGADVRGGYTRPRCFEVSGDSDETCFFDNAKATIFVDYDELQVKILSDEFYRIKNPPLPGFEKGWEVSPLRDYERGSWYTDDACHWYDNGSGMGDHLEKFPCKSIETRDEWEEGYVCVLSDGTGLCPNTGCVLHAGFY